MSMFKKAEKSQVKLRIAIMGPAGSGKTLGALLLARGIHPKGKVAGIDTENNTMSLYGDRFDFDVAAMSPPYLVKKYVMALAEVGVAGYDVVVVDSLSHAWAGEGGILQRKELMDAVPGSNGFTNWGKMTPEHNQLVNAVLHSKTDIICTMRSKTEYVVSTNSKGKQAPQKVGLAPVQRDGFEYEFDIVFEVDANHMARATKDRTGMFDDEIFQLNEKVGAKIEAWRRSGKPLAPASASVPPAVPPMNHNAAALQPPEQPGEPPEEMPEETTPPPMDSDDIPEFPSPPPPPFHEAPDSFAEQAAPAPETKAPVTAAPPVNHHTNNSLMEAKTRALLNALVLEAVMKSRGKLVKTDCYERLRAANLTEPLGQTLITQLKRGDTSFFTR